VELDALATNLKQDIGNLLKSADEKLSNNQYIKNVYVGGKKLTIAVLQESSKNSPESLKTFLEVLTLTGGGKMTKSVAGEFAEIKSAFHSKVKIGSDVEAGASGKINWGYWGGYEKVVQNGKEYAKVGEWLYTRHALENLYPSKMGRTPGHTSSHDPIGVSPNLINDVLNDKTIKVINVQKEGVDRAIHKAGDIEIVTEGKVIITIRRVD
jgi:hypothetical protein